MSGPSDLDRLGYSPRWEALFAPYAAEHVVPGRVVRADRGSVLVSTDAETTRAVPAKRLVRAARSGADLPVAGDWVALSVRPELEMPHVEAVLERSSAFVRGDPNGSAEDQVLAANIDTVFLVHPIADGPNLRRIERELSLAWESGATPVVVLTKADLSHEVEAAHESLEKIAFGVDVHVTSASEDLGITPLRAYTEGGRTVALIGPSGAGKSTLINTLLGEDRQETREVRASDGRGRHVTVARELLLLPDGGVLIDTPGLRGLALTGSEEGIASAFPEIEKLSEACRFRDCTHSGEPGCAVGAAVLAGELLPERLDSYHKLLGEAGEATVRKDLRLRETKDRKRMGTSKSSGGHTPRSGGGRKD